MPLRVHLYTHTLIVMSQKGDAQAKADNGMNLLAAVAVLVTLDIGKGLGLWG